MLSKFVITTLQRTRVFLVLLRNFQLLLEVHRFLLFNRTFTSVEKEKNDELQATAGISKTKKTLLISG